MCKIVEGRIRHIENPLWFDLAAEVNNMCRVLKGIFDFIP
jgi:hypothetical protein